jgi:hypothetical protein
MKSSCEDQLDAAIGKLPKRTQPEKRNDFNVAMNGAPGTIRTSDPQIRSPEMAAEIA